MSGLSGKHLKTGQEVNYKDKVGREHAKKDLKEIKGWDLIDNPTPKRIDLLRIDAEGNIIGGVDAEEGSWKENYWDQNPINFNKFQHPANIPTGNFQIRKEQYLNMFFRWLHNDGYYVDSVNPNYLYNALIRYNIDMTQFFLVEYEDYKMALEIRGWWATFTVGKRGLNGERLPEQWISWALNVLKFYTKINGIWVRDRTLEDPKIYEALVERYRNAHNRNDNILNAARSKRKY
jgi:hypothetical protein